MYFYHSPLFSKIIFINALPFWNHLRGFGSKFLFPMKLDLKIALSVLPVNTVNTDILQNTTVFTFSSWNYCCSLSAPCKLPSRE